MRFRVALTLAVLLASCAQLRAAITNGPANPNCIPGSVTKPCR